MPDGMCERVPWVERRVVHQEPGPIGRLLGRSGRDTVVEQIVGHKIVKHYR